MHDSDFMHEHAELSEADRAEIARYIWSQETVELKTVGIDIGSSTSHLSERSTPAASAFSFAMRIAMPALRAVKSIPEPSF
jgi:hypothetical protein